MKTVKEKKRELKKAVTANENVREIYREGDLVITESEVIRYDGDYKAYYYTSSYHWTSDAVRVVQENTGLRKPTATLSYGSGGTIPGDDEKIAKAMEIIFREARKRIKKLQSD